MNTKFCTSKCKKKAIQFGIATLIAAGATYASVDKTKEFPNYPINGVAQAKISIDEGIYKRGFELCIEGNYAQFSRTRNFSISDGRGNIMYAKALNTKTENLKTGPYIACGKVFQYIPVDPNGEKGTPYFSMENIYSNEENPQLIQDFSKGENKPNSMARKSFENLISKLQIK